MTATRRSPAPVAPTLVQVAARAGVSRQTVSNALNRPSYLAPPTLAKVQAAIDELGYRPSRAARSLRTRASRMIGFGVQPGSPGDLPVVLDRFLHAIAAAAAGAGYRIVLFPARTAVDEVDSYEDLLAEGTVDAFVLGSALEGDPRAAWLAEHGVPFVVFGRPRPPSERCDWVDVDGAAGIYAAVEQLTALGHRRVGFLGWPKGSAVGEDRLSGWRSAMAAQGLATRGLSATAANAVEPAAAAARVLLGKNISALVAVSDIVAFGAYRAARALGKEPGRDVAIVGFDDSPAASVMSPPLASVAQPIEEAGTACVSLLMKRLADPSLPPQHLVLVPRLILRASATHGPPSG